MIERIIWWIRSHPRLVWFFAFLCLVLLFMSGYGFVNVRLDSTDNTTITLQGSAAAGKGLRKGVNFVQRGKYTLSVRSEDKQTEQNITVYPFFVTTANISLASQKQITKTATKGLGCVAPVAGQQDSSNRATLSFVCGLRTPYINKYAFTDRPSSSKSFDLPVFTPVAYQGGVLGMSTVSGHDDELQLAHIKDGSVTPLDYSLPATLDPSLFKIILLRPGSSDGGFVVANFESRTLSFFNNSNSKFKELQFNDSKTRKYSLSSLGGTVFLVSSPVSKSKGAENESLYGGDLRVYKTNNQEGVDETVISIPDNVNLAGLQAIAENVFVTRDIVGVLRVYELKNSFKLVGEIGGTDSFMPHDRSVIYGKGKDVFIYRYDLRQSQLVYRFESLTPSTLQRTEYGTYVGVVDKLSGVQYSFLLSLNNNREDGVEKVLNYPSSNNQLLRFIDYAGNNIYAELNLVSLISDHQTGEFGYDRTELHTKRESLMELMRADGLDPSKFTIVTE